MDPLAQALLTALSGLIGALAGGLAALRRFKQERAFDRRLAWFETTLDALYRASDWWDEIDLVMNHDPGKNPDLKKQLAKARELNIEAWKATDEAIDHIGRAGMYASKSTVQATHGFTELVAAAYMVVQDTHQSGASSAQLAVRATAVRHVAERDQRAP